MHAQFAQADTPPIDRPLIDALGGRRAILQVHKTFYAKVYAHPWLRGFFIGVGQEHQINQLTDFMVGLFGGPRMYSGRLPNKAHPHLLVTDEVFDIRHDLLRQAIEEAGIDNDLAAIWLERDELFRKVIVKTSVSECHGRYKNEPIVAPARPGMCPAVE